MSFKSAFSWAFFLLCAASTLPLILPRYVPVQDLPQHLAAIRVLHSYADPAFDFARYFEVDLLRTQYLLYYAAAHLLAFVVDLETGNTLLMAGCVLLTPYALRALLTALGRDERLALFALPLAYNAHLVLGFVNFLWAITLMFYGLALAVRQRRAPSTARALGLSLLLLACFYAHIVPFALLGIGFVLIALGRDLRGSVQRLLPLVPATLASLLWVMKSPAGQATWSAARGTEELRKPVFQPAAVLWEDVPNWLTDVLHGETDLESLHATCAVFAITAIAGVICALIVRLRGLPRTHDPLSSHLIARLALLPCLAAALYFVAPTSYDWIWPIAQRFPLLAMLLAIVVLPVPTRHLMTPLAFAIVVIAALQTQLVLRAFSEFDRSEVGDFDRALEHIPERSRVAGLIFARGSQHVKFSPFIHYVAYYQARRGGAVMFTFADFPQSPFRFRPDHRPPKVPPRWEWMPERVRTSDLDFYDYVLARGGPGVVARDPKHYALVYRGRLWSVWKRLRDPRVTRDPRGTRGTRGTPGTPGTDAPRGRAIREP